MRMLPQILSFMLLLPGVTYAQATTQQVDSSPNIADFAAELRGLHEELSRTKQQVAAQQQEIEALKAQSKIAQSSAVGRAPISGATEAGAFNATPPSAGSASLAPKIHNRAANTMSPPAACKRSKRQRKLQRRSKSAMLR